MIYFDSPADFSPRFSIVSCFLQYDKKFLLLHRQEHKAQGNTWGVPAGKIDGDESEIQAMLREAQEETGISLAAEDLKYIRQVYVRYPDYDFIYHMFAAELDQEPLVTINPAEHKEFQWISPEDALQINLMPDLDHCIKFYYQLGAIAGE